MRRKKFRSRKGRWEAERGRIIGPENGESKVRERVPERLTAERWLAKRHREKTGYRKETEGQWRESHSINW